ncbi:guanosine-3',5'-bis(diphosphate) 3'-pyrophosphohydrolase [Legionella geestiana]|uniref:guanosine-3',5'-bis(diphosphate) 3'-diphosphatase n=1 Tax=Legionella geestiana TaxID=45065 RepID=A0A0W0U1N8_9GAMM|nr:bifunctional GTP diphosphokinase/guanosine-3',5'-bis pyrophosphate 3'-pyrophosphohydrolase [Legionella geestiana]KTD01998.1 guanosine-3',5'-bis(diphosphate) 3'-pyrophosphohydrolase [Legionella geestiana]QBS12041.1 bifunctional GTP diphosphokinase/guanosine-3',5'-bis pyrophosphate 3'-pyrophosphohydrolase [Legionella geestiana]QDQ40349.1 bifunctional GTP diphosphokinase/guanosine-3',5'-bis pyrophosphate 3'-pyrophosphohydrolase [Legionella geestiana]STX53240.1 guanosine-3',5'-bis(diphosphate) 3
MSYFGELHEELEHYLEPELIEKCRKAYLLAEKAHQGQMRRSGEPYITHPVAAALILARMRLDYQTIMATLLHDVVEDTGVSKETLQRQFGDEVTALVDGVTKLTKIKFESRAEAQAENFRKMVLAMVKDIRVIIVKLADRLHNMRTLGAMPAVKRRRIAIETLEIYAPIANRLGMHTLYVGLEDLGFQALYPMRYRAIKSAFDKARGNRRELTQQIEHDLQRTMETLGIPFQHVFGRQKHLYGIYRKMRQKRASFAEITDVFAFRVITADIDACYRVMGALHCTYKPVPQRFKDYIGIPKANGYQSLHTTLFGPFGVPLEVQIRTRDMDSVAENGVAAHWIYKSSGREINEAQLRAREWVQRLLELQRGSGNSLEFIENVKIDLFPDEIYVFTPKGHIMELPKGATPVDFAYTVHSDVGNTCVAAKVNRRLVPLSMPLVNGQTVEIITASDANPNPAWLNFVVTGKARSNIRHFLKTRQHSESVQLGKRLLEQALESLDCDYARVPPESMQAVMKDLNYKTTDELLHALGMGNQMPMVIARRLVADEERSKDEKSPEKDTCPPLAIKGTEGMVVQFADCCQPLPGDSIVGRFQQGRGIVVHTSDCPRLNPARSNPEQCIPLRWDENVRGEYWVDITVEVANQRGVLATLASAISDSESNIGNISVDPGDGCYNAVTFSISVRDRKHLARVMRRLRAYKIVTRLYRNRQGSNP